MNDNNDINERRLPLFESTDFVSEDKNEMMSNPFLYSYEKAFIKVNSLEEFGLKYKKRKILFGSLVRNERIPKRVRKRLVRRYFKRNKKEFLLTKKEQKNKCEINDELIETVEIEKIKFKTKLLIILILAINIICLSMFNGLGTKIFNNEWAIKFGENLERNGQNSFIVSLITTLSLASIVCTIIYLNLYKIISHDFVKMKGMFQDFVERTFIKMESVFKKEYKKSRKYYLRLIRKEKYDLEPIALESLWALKDDFSTIAKSGDDIRSKVVKVKRFQDVHKLIKNFLYLVALASNIALLGYVVVLGIINI